MITKQYNFQNILENLDYYVEIFKVKFKISARESLRYYELEHHKLLLDEGCSKLLVQRKQDKLQWLQDSSPINGDNLNNV
jgi:hypothetical protein